VSVLNLFGYTGLASLAAAQAGASVTHVDASKKSVGWARQNQALSQLADRPIRWIVDDALKFIQREDRRGTKYHGIIMDPPKFGRGPKGEVWECFEMLPQLLETCRRILHPQALFLVVTAYAIRASALSLYFALDKAVQELGGTVECGELVTLEQSARRVLSNAIFARWCKP
jgi:23S rRNA (cytosine1962-C5)-methyltransferase